MSVCCDKCGSRKTAYKEHRCPPKAVTLPDDGELCVLMPVAQVVWWCSADRAFKKIGSRDLVDATWVVNEWIGLGRKEV